MISEVYEVTGRDDEDRYKGLTAMEIKLLKSIEAQRKALSHTPVVQVMDLIEGASLDTIQAINSFNK